mgnify:CR=1 FL=1
MTSLLMHPALSDCRRVFLRNFQVMSNIGVHDFEKRGEQRVLFNVELYVPLADASGACAWAKGWAVPVASPAFLHAAAAV